MIPGTSKILSKSGPGDFRIITKMLQQIQEKLWEHLGNILFLSICDIKIFEKIETFRNLYVLGTRVVPFFSRFVSMCFLMFVGCVSFLFGISCVFVSIYFEIILVLRDN